MLYTLQVDLLHVQYWVFKLVAFARNCSSPRSFSKELLWLPLFPSGFGWILTLASRGVATGLASSICSRSKINSIYFPCEIVMEFFVWVISIPTIFAGSPISVASHYVCHPSSAASAVQMRQIRGDR